MKVELHLETTPTFGALEVGDTFEFNTKVFMKIEDAVAGISPVNAVRLSTGQLIGLEDHHFVIRRKYKAVPDVD